MKTGVYTTIGRRFADIEDSVFGGPIEKMPHASLASEGRRAEQVTEEIHKKQKAWTDQALWEMIERKPCLKPALTVSMERAKLAKKVFNAGARDRPYAITSDDLINIPVTSALGAFGRDAILACIPKATLNISPLGEVLGASIATDQPGAGPPEELTIDEFDLDDSLYQQRSAMVDACKNRMFVSNCGPSAALGRLDKAIRPETLVKLAPPNLAEVGEALARNGLFLASRELRDAFGHDTFVGCEEPWPLTAGGEGNAVRVNLNSSLGHPYYTSGRDEAALGAALSDARYLLEDQGWRDNPEAAYKRALVCSPDRVLVVGKAKPDMYAREKIEALQLRFYGVLPAGLKFAMMGATQPFSAARITPAHVNQWDWDRRYASFPPSKIRELGYIRSFQKLGLTGEGPSLILRMLDAQLEEHGHAMVHCGDDMLLTFLVVMESVGGTGPQTWPTGQGTRLFLVVFSGDQSNFDLSQDAKTLDPIHNGIKRGLDHIDRHRAGLWRAVARERNILTNRACVVKAKGLGFSGNTLQTEVNGVAADIIGQRTFARLKKFRTTVTSDGVTMPAYCCKIEDFSDALRLASASLGFSGRIDNLRSVRLSGNPIIRAGDGWELDWLPRHDRMVTHAVTTLGLSISFLGSVIGEFCLPTTSAGEYRPTAGTEAGLRYVRHGRTFPPGPRQWTQPCVSVVPDMARFLSSLPYPKGKYEKDQRRYDVADSVRVFSMMLGAGCLFALAQMRPARMAMSRAILRTLAGIPDDFPIENSVQDVYMEEGVPQFDTVGALRARVQRFEASAVDLVDGGAFDPYRPLRAEMPQEAVAPAQVADVGSAMGERTDWADYDDLEAESLLELYRQGELAESGPPVDLLSLHLNDVVQEPPRLAALAFRAVTRANFGRPPPSVAVRSDPRPKAEQPTLARVTATATQKRNAQRRRAKGRAREVTNDDETRANLAAARAEEEYEDEHDADREEERARRRRR